MARTPLSSTMTLAQLAELATARYIETGDDQAAFDMAVEADGQNLIVRVRLKIEPASSGPMLPGFNP